MKTRVHSFSRDWLPTTFGKVLGAGKTGLALDLGEIAVDRRKVGI